MSFSDSSNVIVAGLATVIKTTKDGLLVVCGHAYVCVYVHVYADVHKGPLGNRGAIEELINSEKASENG